MFDFDDPGEELDWMEDELLEEEEYEEDAPRHRWGSRNRRAEPEGEREAIYVESTKRKREKGIGKLKFLAFLEILAIAAVIWGWIKWLY